MSGFLISLSEPNLNGNEKKYLTEAIDSQWVSITGPFVSEFKKTVEDYIGTKHAVPMQSGTSALHMSLIIQGIKENDEVIVPTVSFIASVNCLRYVGAEPIFMDCDEYGTMDMDKLKMFCEKECNHTKDGLINKNTNKKITAIIVTHLFGNMCDMEALMPIVKKYNLKLIEDSAQSLGTYYTKGIYKGKFAGTFGDCGVYSYNSNKIITTGSGGTLVIQNDELEKELTYLITQAKDDGLRYVHHNVGYNYMMNNLQAAVGIAQMERLEEFILNKEHNYNLYKEEISKIEGLELLPFRENCRPNYWFYTIKVNEKEFGLSREQLMQELMKRRIQTRPVWGLIHKQQPYIHNYAYDIEKALEYSTSLLNIPSGSGLTTGEVRKVVEEIKDIQKNNCEIYN